MEILHSQQRQNAGTSSSKVPNILFGITQTWILSTLSYCPNWNFTKIRPVKAERHETAIL